MKENRLARFSGFIALLWVLVGCANEEATTIKIIKQMESDHARAVKKTILVGWNEPGSFAKFGLAPNPNIDGKTLAEVVTSQKAGRDDGQLCSACHHQDDPQGGYGVAIARNGASPALKPSDMGYHGTGLDEMVGCGKFVRN